MTSRKETERTKLIQEKCQNLLTQMLRDEDNKYCVDCDAKGPRWASWNLGVFLCIRCAGIHRNLGVHISRVKSVNLDSWTPEQVTSLQHMGNSRARAVYEAQLPDGFRRPQTDTALESFIRAKYEHKKYLAREWVPPSPPKVDWGKEIDEEIEKQKRKKKSTSNQLGGISAPLVTSSGISSGSDKKMSSTSNSIKNTPLPAPLPKPKSSNSPKTSNRIDLNSSTPSSGNTAISINHSSDLLGLSSPTNTIDSIGDKNQNGSEQFTNFLSAATLKTTNSTATNGSVNAGKDLNKTIVNSLAKEEEDFFNQTTSLCGGTTGDRDKTGKLTKDSILALYGTSGQNTNPNSIGQFNNNALGSVNSGYNTFSGGFLQSGIPNQPQKQSQHTFTSSNINLSGTGSSGSALSANLNLNLAGMPQGLLGPPHQVNQIVHPHQFMQPPSSMYNAPVMTAPNAFTSTSGGSGGSTVPLQVHQYQNMNMQQQFGQFPSQNTMNLNNLQMHQQTTNIFPGSFNSGAVNNLQSAFGNTQNTASSVTLMGGTGQQSTTSTSLSQQFGNLNLGNVWQ